MQASLRRRHAQVPALHSICPQQSRDVAHVPAAGWQQYVPVGSTPHEKSPQHTLEPCVQLRPEATHIPPSPVAPSKRGMSTRGTSTPVPPPSEPVPASMVTRRHDPLWQLRPVQHSLLSRHPAFSARHAQRPLVQDM